MKRVAGLWVLALALAIAVPGRAWSGDERPVWWESSIGRAPVVLPGFTPVRANGTRIELGGRSYIWERSFLPVRIESLGRRLTGPLEIIATVGAKRIPLRADSVAVVESHADHALVRAKGNPLPGLEVECTTRIEYDGVAMVTLTVTPKAPVAVSGLVNEIAVARNEWTRLVAFQATANPNSNDNARRVMKKPALYAPDLHGPFRNVLGFPDGDRSFWWFADNAEGWIWNGPDVTEVLERPGEFLMRQHLIGADWTISAPMTFRFNFLATPVRDLGSAWRSERVTARPPEDSGEEGKFNYWWEEALAHPVLPYTAVPPEIRAAHPEQKWDSRPARGFVRKKMQAYKARGFQRLPYFSGHCLVIFDPALQAHRKEWEMDPPFVHNWGSTPTPCMSHRAAGYSNYILHRLSAAIDEIEMPGIYFDQGGVFDSRNPAHGGWTDSNGQPQASLEILAYRDFLKRLRVLFFEKGQPGTVVTHNSGSEVIPGLTFVSSNLDGEQFRQPGRLRNDDYIASASLDEVRSLYAGGQFGVLNTWLPSMWASHAKDRSWDGSAAQYRSYRSLMTLALLHDIPILPLGVARKDYDALNHRLDDFGVGVSDFVGYWSERFAVRSAQPEAPISYYRRADRSAAMLVVANLRTGRRSIDLHVDPAALGLQGRKFAYAIQAAADSPLPADGVVRVPVPPRDFALLEVRAAD